MRAYSLDFQSGIIKLWFHVLGKQVLKTKKWKSSEIKRISQQKSENIVKKEIYEVSESKK